jgi:hypothetical protein
MDLFPSGVVVFPARFRLPRQVGAGSVPVQALEEEQVDGRDRVEDAVAPAAPQGPTDSEGAEGFS